MAKRGSVPLPVASLFLSFEEVTKKKGKPELCDRIATALKSAILIVVCTTDRMFFPVSHRLDWDDRFGVQYLGSGVSNERPARRTTMSCTQLHLRTMNINYRAFERLVP